MKPGFFTMPVHPAGKDWRTSLAEDRATFQLADEPGFVEGYVGEHATGPEENITSASARARCRPMPKCSATLICRARCVQRRPETVR